MEPIRFLIAAIVAVAEAIPLLLATRRVRPAGERMVEEARRAGRTAQAVLVKSTYLRGDVRDPRGKNRRDQWMAVYAYEVDGVSYTYRETTFNEPVPALTLYYPAGRPGTALSRAAGPSRFGGGYLLRVLAPLAVWALVYWILQFVW